MIFELSKVENVTIRARVVSHLLNVDEVLAHHFVKGLRLMEMPSPAQRVAPVQKNLRKSLVLSITRNGPQSFKGRKLGIFFTDEANVELFYVLKKPLKKKAPNCLRRRPIKLTDETWVDMQEKIDGSPSVLYDAVALLISKKKMKN